MDKAFIDTVRLLLAAAPEVFRGEVFAMKGGTAITLVAYVAALAQDGWTLGSGERQGPYYDAPR